MSVKISADIKLKKVGKKEIISDFNKNFECGVYCVVGPNGSGKSTLLRILAGMDKSFTGKLEYGVKDINAERTYLPDVPQFYPFMTAEEFVEMVCSIRTISSEKYLKRFRDAFKVDSFFHLPLSALSLGQTKRLFCVVTLIDEVNVWILDEPSNGLDESSRLAVIEAINKKAKKGVVILSEHNQAMLDELEGKRIIELAA